MSISKKVFTTALALLVATSISSARAEDAAQKDSAVLFKIHDIVPIKNSEGDVVACDFNTTFFNRSPILIKEATLELSWQDKTLGEVIDNEKKQDAAKNRRSRGYSRTERNTDQNVRVTVDVPSLKSYKQATVQTRVNTDRCFLLIEKVDFNLRTCTADTASASARRRGGNSECNRMFRFVSPEDEQYYVEFKPVTIEEEKTQQENERLEGKSELDGLYTNTVETLGNAGSVISGIK